MNGQPKVIVIGGSLVGPSMELFLRDEGITDVTTYEALKHPHAQSGGVMGIRDVALDRLSPFGIRDEHVRALESPKVFAYDIDPGGGEPTHRGTSTFPGHMTSWDAMHHELTRRVDIQYGHRIIDTRVHDARYVLTCTCGKEHDADHVIWADGRKSTGRELLHPERPLRYNGYVVWRGLTPEPRIHPVGFDRYYDIPGGRLLSVTEPVNRSASKAHGMSYWEFSHNLSADVWHELAGAAPEDHAYLLPHEVKGQAHDVIRKNSVGLPRWFDDVIDRAEISGIPVNDVAMPRNVAVFNGAHGFSVMLGDAIVPVRLQVGAGLNQGLIQASDLAAVIASGGGQSAVKCWEYAELERLARIVEQGRSRAARNNLGRYWPVTPGKTTAPAVDQWAEPNWVTA